MSNPLTLHADVTIIGGGVVGLTLALAIAQHDVSVLVVDKAQPHELADAGTVAAHAFSSRVSAISHASERVFSDLGIWHNIQRKQAYVGMEVWDKDGFGHIQFTSDEINRDALGHIIENSVLISALLDRVHQDDNIQVLQGTALLNAEHRQLHAGDDASAQYQITLDNQQTVLSSLLVGADGANSYVKKMMGFTETFWDYEHTAIVANIKTQKPHGNIARQAFTPLGPLAFLPLPDAHQCSIVWSQSTQRAKHLMALDTPAFCKALYEDIDGQLGLCELTSERSSFPLRMRYSRQWFGDSVVLVGDAAHTIHPLAGQGANLGIADAITLAACIQKSKSTRGIVNDYHCLRQYERTRKSEAMISIATMEGFKRLFGGNQPLQKLVRNIGLKSANNIRPLKQFFIQQASKA